jgi:putative permease
MYEFLKSWYTKNLSSPQAAILLLQFITIYIIVYYFSNICGPLIAALVLAFMLERPVSLLIRHGASRLNATILIMLSYVVLVCILFITIIPPAVNQLSKFTQNISQIINNNHQIENTNLEDLKLKDISSNSNSTTINSVNNDTQENTESVPTSIANKLNIQNNKDKVETDSSVSWIITKINDLKQKLPESYQNLISQEQLHELVSYLKLQIKQGISPILTTQLAPFIMDTISLLMYMIIVPIFSFYMLKDKEKLLNLSKKYLSNHNDVTNFWVEMNKQISQYLNGKCIHVLIIAFVNGLSFWFLGINYALLLGIGVGLSVLIPYVGAIIISIPVIFIGILQFGFSSDFAWLIGIYLIIQILDGYALTPMLFSETLNIDPFSILVAIIIFGAIWGIWGVILAIPLATFIKTLFKLWPTKEV